MKEKKKKRLEELKHVKRNPVNYYDQQRLERENIRNQNLKKIREDFLSDDPFFAKMTQKRKDFDNAIKGNYNNAKQNIVHQMKNQEDVQPVFKNRVQQMRNQEDVQPVFKNHIQQMRNQDIPRNNRDIVLGKDRRNNGNLQQMQQKKVNYFLI